jgi:hypothetical protein
MDADDGAPTLDNVDALGFGVWNKKMITRPVDPKQNIDEGDVLWVEVRSLQGIRRAPR